MDRVTFARGGSPSPIPQQRVREKLDDYMAHRDYAGAERHLEFWLEEATAAGDQRGELMVRNELIGHFRKTGNAERAFLQAEEALRLLKELDFEETLSAGTTYTNIGTAFNAFGKDRESLELFRKAAAIYEGSPQTDPRLLGGLYNNMALTCVSLSKFDEAESLFRKALEQMERVEHGELERAITYLNMADAVTARADALQADGDSPEDTLLDDEGLHEEEIERLLDTALELLDTPTIPRDGYYAFVCEKCALTFAYYGYFLAYEDLQARAEDIYGRA